MGSGSIIPNVPVTNSPVQVTINDIYEFRKFNRETFTKADMIGDLSGVLLNIRNITKVEKVFVDVSNFLLVFEDSKNQNRLGKSVIEADKALRDFLRRFSYMSNLPDELADKYELYLKSYPIFDIIQIGNSIKISF